MALDRLSLLLAAALVLTPAAATSQLVASASALCSVLPDSDDGIAACRRAVRQVPEDTASWRTLAAHLAKRGRTKEAIAAYREVIRLDERDADVALQLARLEDEAGRSRDALHWYRRFAELEPRESRAHQLVGWTLVEMRRYEDALASFREAVRLDPSQSGGHLGAGLTLGALRRHEEALRSYGEAARLDPRSTTVLAEMARTALELGRLAEAVSYWERALVVDPGYFDGRRAERRQWEQAVRRAGRQPPAKLGLAVMEPAEDDKTAVAAPPPPPTTRAAAAPRRTRRADEPTASGSGLVISGDGHVLTNKHVVRGCSRLRVRGDSLAPVAAKVVAVDPDDDLAALATEIRIPSLAAFRDGPALRAGEDVIAVGYPLAGLLADQLVVTVGSVNALAGVRNDPHVFQMSAPVQPGSSGGPLFDASGNVIGIVVTKLNARVIAEETGDIPQNVNFALKSDVAREFLDAHGITYNTAPSLVARARADVGDIARPVTVMVECFR